jgi:tripeptide aminopeptidase
MSTVMKRFLRYVKVDTASDDTSESVPSTKTQLEFAKTLGEELKDLGLRDVSVDDNGYVMATLPSNVNKSIPTIGFISHMDTIPDVSGKDVKPKIINNYDGSDIILNEEKNIVLSVNRFPHIKNYIGQTIITSDGTTLLGADNKAGIAEIITSVEYLINNPNILHGTIKIGFTPDEEIGRGADHFDVKKFNADFAYTVDGGPIGEINYENFNAASAKISIKGTNIHPGTAKDMMVNSILIGTELNNMLPVNERPEYTEGYEGFYHITRFKSTVEETKMEYIIRDHDMDKFNEKKELIKEIVKFLNKKYNNIISLEIEDSYYNMKEKIIPHFEIIAIAKQAMEELGIEAKIRPIRGGTDGAMLSYKGLLCPNIFTGGHNYHGKYEYIPVIAMEKAVQVIVKIIELNIEKNLKN